MSGKWLKRDVLLAIFWHIGRRQQLTGLKMEIRSYGGEASPKIEEGRTIVGYAIVFNQRSEVLYDEKEGKLFHEIISERAVSDDLLQRSDIKALIEHNKERLLARWKAGVGTLSLTIDEHGLMYRFNAPNTPDGDYALEMVGRGDIQGSSFAYQAYSRGAVTWTKESNGIWLRKVNLIDTLRDVTITAYPAFTGTEVSVRSIEDLDISERANDDKNPEKDKTDYIRQINFLRKLI